MAAGPEIFPGVTLEAFCQIQAGALTFLALQQAIQAALNTIEVEALLEYLGAPLETPVSIPIKWVGWARNGT
jgi:hypothetical protein